MSTTGISFGGLASGLDTQAIISALLSVEQRPITQLESKKTELNRQRTLFGDIGSRIEALVAAAGDIRRTSSFLDFKASVDSEDRLTATASNAASSGSYSVSVDSIAKARVAASEGYSSATASVGTGEIFVQIGDKPPQVVQVGGSGSLQDVASALNGAEGIRANVIDTGNPTDPYQLVVTASDPGTDNEFVLSVDLAGNELTNFVNDLQADQTVAALDAQVTIDGIQYTRSTNQITDAIAGVTLNLVSPSELDAGGINRIPTQLTVTTDTEVTAGRVQEFVDQYNEIIDFVEAQSELDEEGNASSPLFGDSTLRTIRSSLRNIVNGTVDTGDASARLLSQIGIDSDTEGRLTFTRSEFEEALVENEQGVRDLFTLGGVEEDDPDRGIAARIFSELDIFTDSIDGLIKVRTDGIERRTKTIDDSIRRAEDRLEQYELSLTNRFANLEVLLSRLQSQGGAVANIGAGL